MAIQDTFLKDLQNKKSLDNEEIFNKKLDELKVVKLEVLDKIKLISIPQGQGSGLDADYLDGKEGSLYISRIPQSLFDDGTASSPSVSFLNDIDTGLYRITDNNIGFSVSGTLRLDIDATDIVSTLPFRGPNGSVTAPTYSFSGDDNTGVYSPAGGNVSISSDGTQIVAINASGLVSIDGVASQPGFAFKDDVDNGLLRSTTDTIALVAGGSARCTISTGTIANTLVLLGPNGSQAAPTYSFSADTDTEINKGGANEVEITAGNTLSATCHTAGIHIRPSGAPDIELEVSNGASTGWGAIHRASSGTHSSSKIKSSISYYDESKEFGAYQDILSLKPIQFRYKKNILDENKNVIDRVEDKEAKLYNGYIFEEAPESIKSSHETISIDDRIFNLECGFKYMARKILHLENK